jgi:hypothetical protein
MTFPSHETRLTGTKRDFRKYIGLTVKGKKLFGGNNENGLPLRNLANLTQGQQDRDNRSSLPRRGAQERHAGGIAGCPIVVVVSNSMR